MPYEEKGNGVNPVSQTKIEKELTLYEQFHKRIGKLVKGNILDRHIKFTAITEKRRKDFIEYGKNPRCRLPIRLRLGSFYTKDERKERIEKMLNKKAPLNPITDHQPNTTSRNLYIQH